MKKAFVAALVLALAICVPALGEEVGRWPGGAVIEEARLDLLGTLESLMTDVILVQGNSTETQKAVDLYREVLDAEPAGARVYPWPDFHAFLEYYGDRLEISDAAGMSDAGREYVKNMTPAAVMSYTNMEEGTFWIVAQSLAPLNGFYALPEGFEDCVAVYDYGEVSLVLLLREQTVVDQAVVSASACFGVPKVEEVFSAIAELAD